MTWEVLEGDCLDVMPTLAAQSVDAVVTDPPAGIAFMGKAWDGDKGGRNQWIAWLTEVMGECLRVLKPGGHALVWALPRTSHWTATAVEDAGFEVRDVIMHIFGSGFPKSLDLSKAIDKAAGAEREVIGMNADFLRRNPHTAPATEAAKQWQGWGTALKPAAEHWILARKPLIGTVAANVQEHGTGAINIDGCRVPGALDGDPNRFAKTQGGDFVLRFNEAPTVRPEGRWPANVTLSEDAAQALDAQSGDRRGAASNSNTGRGFSRGGVGTNTTAGYADSGGASRFFYVAKPSTKERNMGCEGLPETSERNYAGGALNRPEHASSDGVHRTGARAERTNNHPCVKPIALMRYLCRLITPPNGIVLDPFTGSGTTGCAAVLEGFDFVGIEQSADYCAIARRRLAEAAAQPRLEGVA